MIFCIVCDINLNKWTEQHGKIIIQEAYKVIPYAKNNYLTLTDDKRFVTFLNEFKNVFKNNYINIYSPKKR